MKQVWESEIPFMSCLQERGLPMITVEQAIEKIQQVIPPKQEENVPLPAALGRITVEDILAPEPSPRYTQSAMDGYAVRWVDVQSVKKEGPVKLVPVGESRAGMPFSDRVYQGEAISISTGAMLPDDVDTVLPVEETREEPGLVAVQKVQKQRQHVRFEGEEMEKGDLLLPGGTLLNPAKIGLLASLGITSARVYKTPAVGIISTGTELIPYDQPVKPWQIRDSNSMILAAAVHESGGKVVCEEHADDDLEALRRPVKRALDLTDILLISGGVSVGPHDHVRNAVQQLGFEPVFWKVQQKPGKPLFVAHKGSQLVFGLPGNPVSAFVCYTYYVHPVIQSLKGAPFKWSTMQGMLTKALRNPSQKTNFVRVKTASGESIFALLRPIEKQGSHMLTSIAKADGFIILEPGQQIKAGEIAEVYLFS